MESSCEFRLGSIRGLERNRRAAIIQLPSGEIDLDQLIDDLEHLPTPGERPDGGYFNFQTQVTHGHTSWGADGSAVEAILNIGLSIGATAIYEIMRVMMTKYTRDVRDRGYRHEWTDAQLIEHGQTMLARVTSSAAADIQAVSIERELNPERASICYNVGGASHTLTIRMVNEIPIVQKHLHDL